MEIVFPKPGSFFRYNIAEFDTRGFVYLFLSLSRDISGTYHSFNGDGERGYVINRRLFLVKADKSECVHMEKGKVGCRYNCRSYIFLLENFLYLRTGPMPPEMFFELFKQISVET